MQNENDLFAELAAQRQAHRLLDDAAVARLALFIEA
jgi:hypothetical protein